MRSESSLILILFVAILVIDNGDYCRTGVVATTVTYDHRALVIDGHRRILFSGSIHYPRTTPEVWGDIIRKSKEGGLDVIETYVFWNYHEPVRGEYYFEGRFDLVRFVKTVHEAGLFVHLRIGPYACAEWNYGGFPMWLHLIPGIQFRTSNTLFKIEMRRFLSKIVDMMKEEKLFASQGGPIILAQVENEYGNVEWAYGIGGKLYVKWAAETAVQLNTTVPWVMCQQEDAPDPVINTCNGFYCDQFTPNSPSKPKIWTENYSGWFLAFGNSIPFRPVEDLAFSVARFFETGGTFQNYYMYFGGTNFGRTAGGPLVATSYDYDAPIDEYGFIRQPKWGHLRNLHKAIKQCERYLVGSDPTYKQLGVDLEAHIYYRSANECAAFLANIDKSSDANVTFNGKSYSLPAWSVSILPDCKNVVFNTAKVVSQKSRGDISNAYNSNMKGYSLAASTWGWYKEQIGIWGENYFTSTSLLEQINTTKDTSDFLWYTTSINVNKNHHPGEEQEVVLNVESSGHAALIFVNKKVVGFGFGNHEDGSFSFTKNIALRQGNNTLEILSMMIGLQNYGPWFDIAGAGISLVSIVDSNVKEDLSYTEWTYQVGLEGEYLGLDKKNLANSSLWNSGDLPLNHSLIWYKTAFIAPDGNGPLALNLGSMGKGQAWVNGQSIGRYWPDYHAPSTGCTKNCDYRGSYDASKCLKNCGQPTQTLYHVPRSWVNPGENLLVLHEELGGDPSKISVLTRTGLEVCAHVFESDPPQVDALVSDLGHISPVSEVRLTCEQGWKISSINFASFGTPNGECGKFRRGKCHAKNANQVVREVCLGRESCAIPLGTTLFGDPCPGMLKSLAIEALCTV